jgi:amidohydrolase
LRSSLNGGLSPACANLVGCLEAGDYYNVLPQTARIMGYARTFNPEVRDARKERIRQVAEGITDCKIAFFRGDGPVVNDPLVTRAVRAATVAATGAEWVLEPPLSWAAKILPATRKL